MNALEVPKFNFIQKQKTTILRVHHAFLFISLPSLNLRVQLFKTAVSTEDQEIHARCKRVINEISPQIGNARAQCLKEKVAKVCSGLLEAELDLQRGRMEVQRSTKGKLK